MATKGKDGWGITHEATGNLLLAYENGRKWRFHAFIGDSWPSEGEAKAKLEELVKIKAIPSFKYKVIKQR